MFWPEAWKSICLGCGEHLAISAVPFSGEIACPECGSVNVFKSSQHPSALRDMMGNYEGRPETIRGGSRQPTKNFASTPL